MRRLRQADLGDRRHHHAPLQAAADHLVLGGLSDRHPFQWHLGPATATPARPRLLQIGLADLRQAAPQHGRSRPHPARRPGQVDETEIACRSKNDPLTGGGGRSHRQNADRRRRRGARTAAPVPAASVSPNCPTIRPRACTLYRPKSRAGCHRQDRWMARLSRGPGVSHDPHVIGKMAAHVVLPWVHRIFSNLKVWALGVYQSRPGRHIPKRRRGHQYASTERRLITTSPKFRHSSSRFDTSSARLIPSFENRFGLWSVEARFSILLIRVADALKAPLAHVSCAFQVG